MREQSVIQKEGLARCEKVRLLPEGEVDVMKGKKVKEHSGDDEKGRLVRYEDVEVVRL